MRGALLRAACAVVVALAAGQGGAAAAARPPGFHYPGTAWTWASPSPQGFESFDLSVRGDAIFSLDAAGGVQTIGDGGRRFVQTADGGAYGDAARAGLVALGGHTLLQWDCQRLYLSEDGGRSRKLVFMGSLAAGPCVQNVAVADDRTAYVVLTDGQLFRTDDRGRTFARGGVLPGAAIAGAGVSGISFASEEVGYASVTNPGAGQGQLQRTTDGGTSWSPVRNGPTGAPYAFGANVVYTTFGGRLQRSTDTGASFSPVPLRGLPRGTHPQAIVCSNARRCTILLLGDRGDPTGPLAVTADGGSTARLVPRVLADQIAGDGRIVAAAGDNGRLLTSVDAGASFRDRVSGWESFVLGPLRRGSGRSLLALTDLPATGLHDYPLLRSRDAGRTWSRRPLPGGERWFGFDTAFASDSRGWVLQHDEPIQRRVRLLGTTNGGRSWRTEVSGPLTRMNAVLALRHGLFVGGASGIARVRGHGLQRVPYTRAHLGDVARGRRVAALYGPYRAYATVDGGRTWRRFGLPRGRRTLDLDFADSHVAFAVTYSGALWRTDDGGRRWKRLLGVGPFAGSQVDFSDRRTGVLNASDPILGADPGGLDGTARLLRTTDGGLSWHPQFVERESRITDLVALDSRALSVAIGGALLSTERGGEPAAHTAIRLAPLPRAVDGGRRLIVSGALAPARPGRRVTIGVRSGGRWRRYAARTDAEGRFGVTVTATRSLTIVAQVAGSAARGGAGTVPVSVRVRRSGHGA